MTEKALYLAERDLGAFAIQRTQLPRENIAKNDIKNYFGFDYEPIVVARLKYWNNLPEGYRLNFFDSPQAHEGSKGLYLAEEIVGTSWVFLQAMQNDGISTKHKHEKNVIELYDPLAGKSTLNVDGRDVELKVGVPFEVFPGQAHQLKTHENPSLNLLIMKNSAHIPRNKLHIPVVV